MDWVITDAAVLSSGNDTWYRGRIVRLTLAHLPTTTKDVELDEDTKASVTDPEYRTL